MREKNRKLSADIVGDSTLFAKFIEGFLRTKEAASV
jgi:hypothetical protein